MDDALKECEAEVARLGTENRDLRQAAEEFGELAERLNRALRDRLAGNTREPERDRRGGP